METTEQERICTVCLVRKPIEKFAKNKGKNGKIYYLKICISCRNKAYHKKYYSSPYREMGITNTRKFLEGFAQNGR